MPIYRLTVEKFFAPAGEYWVNVYHVNTTATDFAPIATQLVAAERPLYPPSVLITKVSQDQVEIDTTYGSPQIVNLNGTADFGTGDILPLFVCARVDLMYALSRPGRKYLRAALQEAEVTTTTIFGGALTRLNAYLNALLSIEGLCDEDGDDLIGGAVFPAPAMRQLRRGSKKKLIP